MTSKRTYVKVPQPNAKPSQLLLFTLNNFYAYGPQKIFKTNLDTGNQIPLSYLCPAVTTAAYFVQAQKYLVLTDTEEYLQIQSTALEVRAHIKTLLDGHNTLKYFILRNEKGRKLCGDYFTSIGVLETPEDWQEQLPAISMFIWKKLYNQLKNKGL